MIVCCPDKIFYDGRTTTPELHHGKRYILLLTIIILCAVYMWCCQCWLISAIHPIYLQQFWSFAAADCWRYFVSPTISTLNLPCNFIFISSGAVRYYTYHGSRVRITLPLCSLKYPIKVRSVYQFKYVSAMSAEILFIFARECCKFGRKSWLVIAGLTTRRHRQQCLVLSDCWRADEGRRPGTGDDTTTTLESRPGTLTSVVFWPSQCKHSADNCKKIFEENIWRKYLANKW